MTIAKTRAKAKTKQNKVVKKDGVLSLPVEAITPFKGFEYTVEEGKKLSKRSRTELPEFPEIAREK